MNDWKKLATRVERQRESLRALNDNPELDAVQTALLRGQIRACGWFLNLPTTIQEEAKAKTEKLNEDEDEN